MKILFQFWAAVISFSIFMFILFPLAIIAGTVSRDRETRLKIVSIGWRIFGNGILKIGCLAKITARDYRSAELKKIISPALYICNHQSMIDIPLLLSRFAIPPIMKKEIMKIPIFGIVAKISGAMPVDRKDPNSRQNILKMSFERMKNGFPVQYYPEGTRSKDGKPKPYEEVKMKLVDFAFKNNIPVVCISAYGTKDLLTKNGIVKPFHTLGITIEKEIYPSDFKDKEEFSTHAWNLVCKNFNKLEEIIG